MARERGIKIICDEIMCGLGRHGKGTLFISEAWDLDPDCVTVRCIKPNPEFSLWRISLREYFSDASDMFHLPRSLAKPSRRVCSKCRVP